jgi:hypothetical protein
VDRNGRKWDCNSPLVKNVFHRLIVSLRHVPSIATSFQRSCRRVSSESQMQDSACPPSCKRSENDRERCLFCVRLNRTRPAVPLLDSFPRAGADDRRSLIDSGLIAPHSRDRSSKPDGSCRRNFHYTPSQCPGAAVASRCFQASKRGFWQVRVSLV